MRSNRIRLQIAVLIFILLPAATGVIAVHASATCERFVRTYVTRPVKSHISPATLAAWAAWREAHPDWKPSSDTERKNPMSHDEQVKKIDFACTIPEIPQTTQLFVKTASVEPPPIAMDLPHMTQDIVPTLPLEVAEVTPWPPLSSFVPPVTPQESTPVGGPTPEPMPVILVLSGIVGLGLLQGVRRFTAAA